MMQRQKRGFTLVEVMVALAIMGIVTAMAWQGISAIMQAQKFSRSRSDEVAVMQTMLAQWGSDLDHIEFNPGAAYAKDIPPLQYENQVLRLLRWDDGRTDRALRVVAWAKRLDHPGEDLKTGTGTLLRWQSPPIASAAELHEAWANALAWAQGSESTVLRATELSIMPIGEWELRPFSQGQWSEDAQNILPSSGNRVQLQGLRLVFSPAAGSVFAGGSITRDWLRPTAPGL